MKLKLIIATVILVLFTGYHGYTHPNRNKLVNIQELSLLSNLTILYAASYHSNSELFSMVSNVMISLALFQFCAIILYHFLTHTCHCDVVVVLRGQTFFRHHKEKWKKAVWPCETNVVVMIRTIKEKLLSKNRSDNQNRFVELLNIPECTYNYTEYQDGLVTDGFVQK